MWWVALALLACQRGGPVAAIHTQAGVVRVVVELAKTPAEQERGLMYRQHLDYGSGMLFLFADEKDHVFWMKNTVIPLDMIFIGGDGRIVGIHADATPLSTAPISMHHVSRYVLEVPAGYVKENRIAAGDRVELPAAP